jgi:hypothetical protein
VTFLDTCLGASLGELTLEAPARGQRCRADERNSNWRLHIRPLMKCGPERLPDLLLAAMVASRTCTVVKEWFERLMKDITRFVDKNVRTMQLPDHPMGLPVLRGSKRARRLNDVLSHNVAVVAVRRKKAQTASAFFASAEVGSRLRAPAEQSAMSGSRQRGVLPSATGIVLHGRQNGRQDGGSHRCDICAQVGCVMLATTAGEVLQFVT